MPFSCAASSASAIWRAIAMASSNGSPAAYAGRGNGGVRRRRCGRRAPKPFRQRVALDELEDQEPDAVCLLEAVDRADVGMIQRREDPRLPLEAREPVRTARERARQDLDRDVAPKLRVARAIDLAHPADAKERLQLIAAERLTGQRRRDRFGDHARREMERRLGEEFIGHRLVQQRLDLAPHRRIVGTGIGQKGGALVWRLLARRVIQALRAVSSVQASCDRSPRISRISQAFASRQSRITVSGETLQHRRGFLDAQSAEKPQLDDAALSLVERRQRVERIIERDEVVRRLAGDR